MDQAQKHQFVRQLDFLLRKTTAWSALMGEQMAMWTKEQEDKEKAKPVADKKEQPKEDVNVQDHEDKEQPADSNDDNAHSRVTRRGTVVAVAEQSKTKRTRNPRKRKVDDEMTEEVN
jgi:hypothetical protein